MANLRFGRMATDNNAAPIGSVAWLEQSGGRLTFGERLRLLAGIFGAIREGMRLRRRARRGERRSAPLALFAPPDTPIVNASRSYLLESCGEPMANHSFRTAYWTMFVLHEQGDVGPADLETAWVAALLHDIGLERPPARGDFSQGGIDVLKALAVEHAWPDDQVHAAAEAIATNLVTRVDATRLGRIAWAMNVGGLGELGFPGHRSQMHPDRIAELEGRYPRARFRREAMQLIRAEARRVRGGRFGLYRWIFPLIMKG
jgi:HD domain-containing protein